MKTNIWKGVLIAESLDNLPLPSSIKIVNTKTASLEKEEDRGIFNFHNIEVANNDLNEVVNFISIHIHDNWYFHLVKDGEIIVVFHNKIFRAYKEDPKKIEKIREYGISQSILKEQLEFEWLIDHPYG